PKSSLLPRPKPKQATWCCFLPLVPALAYSRITKTAATSLRLLCEHSLKLFDNRLFGLQHPGAASGGLVYQVFDPVVMRAAEHNHVGAGRAGSFDPIKDLLPIHGVRFYHV